MGWWDLRLVNWNCTKYCSASAWEITGNLAVRKNDDGFPSNLAQRENSSGIWSEILPYYWHTTDILWLSLTLTISKPYVFSQRCSPEIWKRRRQISDPLGTFGICHSAMNIRKYVLIFSDTLTDLTDITWPSWHSGILAFDLAYLLPFDLTPIRWQILAVCELVMFGSGGARREPTWRGGRRTSYPLVNSHSYGKSPFFIGKPSINGPLSMAMLNLNNQRVYVSATWNGQFEDCPPYKTHRRRITPKLPVVFGRVIKSGWKIPTFRWWPQLSTSIFW